MQIATPQSEWRSSHCFEAGLSLYSCVFVSPAKPHGNAYKEIPSQCEYKSVSASKGAANSMQEADWPQ